MTTITGTNAADSLNFSPLSSSVFVLALDGNDFVQGSGLADTLAGGNGNDVLVGGSGADSLIGGPGDDGLSGSNGSDTLDGGTGFDSADYSFGLGPVTVDLSAGTASDGANGTDSLVDIDIVIGSAFDDRLEGGSAAEASPGAGLFESFRGNAGNDTLDGGGSGQDRVDYLNSPAGVSLNLLTGIAADGFGGTDLLIAIDTARGSGFNDTMVGGNPLNDDFESFEGRGGNDSIDGGSGYDRADYANSPAGIFADLGTGFIADGHGGIDIVAGIDEVRGSALADVLRGGSAVIGNAGGFRFESFVGRAGNDTIDGGGFGEDRADYRQDPAPVLVHLALGFANDGFGGVDTLIDINQARGSAFADTLIGGSGPFERFEGGAGNDLIQGAFGRDEASYQASPGPVTVSLALGLAEDGFGDTDTLVDIEEIEGSAFADTLSGGSTPSPDVGVESFQGRGGNDLIDGGDGLDRATYRSGTGPVAASLALGSAQDGEGGIDTLIDIEFLEGSAFNDTLIGSGGEAEEFQGRAGDDSIDGGAGHDEVAFRVDPQAVSVNLGLGIATDGYGGSDVLVDIEGVEGSDFADTILGSAFADVLDGRAGNDTLDGAGAFDIAEYNQALAGIAVNLALGTAADGYGGIDLLIGIEGVRGSLSGDLVYDNAGDNLIEGGAGGDTILSTGGLDTIYGNGGDDIIAYAPTSLAQGGIIDGGAGFDILLVQIDGIVDLTLVTIAGVEQVEIVGSGILGLPGATDQALNFGAGADIIVGRDGAESLDGGGGADTLFGGRGGDSLAGGAEGDILVGDEQGAFVGGVPGADTLDGGVGSDTLFGQDENDVLRGGLGGDILVGEAGSDVLGGDAEDDTLFGGAGADTLFGGQGADALIAFHAFADAASDVMAGGAGNDTLYGSHGDEVLLGEEGDDFLVAGPGGDTLIGGLGSDVLFTGDGADLIVLTPGGAAMLVADFERGVDRVGVASELFGFVTLDALFQALTLIPYANGVELSLPGHDFRLTLVGANLVERDDFVLFLES